MPVKGAKRQTVKLNQLEMNCLIEYLINIKPEHKMYVKNKQSIKKPPCLHLKKPSFFLNKKQKREFKRLTESQV